MQCPICHNDMETYQEDTTQSKKTDTLYKRTRYVCRKDDVWGRLEIPQEKKSESEIKGEVLKI